MEKRELDKRELTAILQNPESATHRLLMMWRDVPLLLMLDVDWGRGPLVLIGKADGMMWPLLPPGSLLQLDQRVRTISDGRFSEAERPVYRAGPLDGRWRRQPAELRPPPEKTLQGMDW